MSGGRLEGRLQRQVDPAGSLPPIASDSFYITTRDGTKLGTYLFRPSVRRTGDSLPVVWMHNRYHSGEPTAAQLGTWLEHYPLLRSDAALVAGAANTLAMVSLDGLPWAKRLVARGYAVALVDARGTGASFGNRAGPFSPDEAKDAADVTTWFASQSWSSGRVGMFGRSYMGTAQYFAAAETPALGAIFPEMALFDLYSFVYAGGIFRHNAGRRWADEVLRRDHEDRLAPVATDPDGALLAQARAEHAGNRDSYSMFAALPYRDSRDPLTGVRPFMERSPSFLAGEGRRPAAPVYLLAGWYDAFVRDALLWYHNAVGPRRLVIGPWAHSGSLGFDMFEEHARWYDAWLRGEDSVDDVAPIYYSVVGARYGSRWRTTDVWPIRDAVATSFYLRAGRANSCRSINDGRLTSEAAAPDELADVYNIDYTTTTGPASRWAHACGGAFDYPILTLNDEKGLTYTTPPLDAETELTGHPIVHLWVSSQARDVDVFAYLEEVDREGRSHYMTEGALRASHRQLVRPRFEYLDLPYHGSCEADIAPLPAHPVELVFDLLPLSRLLPRGARIRLTIVGADQDNARTPVPREAFPVRIHHDATHRSAVELPLVRR